jgi:hypothetical protein
MKTVDVQALKDVFRSLSTRMREIVPDALEWCGSRVEDRAKSMVKGRTDESINGEPFRVQTGLAKASITHILMIQNGKYAEEIGSNVQYFTELELGRTNSKGQLVTHPVLGPALAIEADTVYAFIGAALRKAIP